MDLAGDRIYLDYNATTPLEPEVLTEIQAALQNAWGNPSSSYETGVKAKQIINDARKHVADVVGGTLQDIIFTSGGTEANNMVLQTALEHFWRTFPRADEGLSQKGDTGRTCLPHFITSNLEHDSIKLVLEHFEREGKAEVTYVAASPSTGCVEAQEIAAAVRPTTCMVTVMMANNETGILQPVQEITERIKGLKRNPKHEVPKILLHTDAAQAIGKVKVDVEDLGVDYLTIVGHKFYGPRIGALYVRSPGVHTPLHPMFYGGGQERNFRPGTENTGMIAGLGKAAELVVKNLVKYQQHLSETRDYLEEKIKETFGEENIHFNGRFKGSERIPNTCNVSVLGEDLQGVKVLSKCKHIQASVGAACHSGSGQRASPILLAVGIPVEVATNAMRLSIGRETTKEDIDLVVKDLRMAVDDILSEVK